MRLLDYENLPTWMHQHSDAHIRTSYRPPLQTSFACFGSLLYVHNEWMNSWSHYIPATGYMALLTLDLWRKATGQGLEDFQVKGDGLVLQMYMLGTALCLFMSVSDALIVS